MKFIEFADRDTQCCYNANHVILATWRVDTNVIHIETITKAYTHIFEDAKTAKFVYYNHIMGNLIEEV